MPVLDREFNGVVKFFGSLVPHTLTCSEYKSFEEMKKFYEDHGYLKINVDHSDKTIFGDPTVNWLFRAWHDMCHVIENAGFDREGETKALRLMQKQINDYPSVSVENKTKFNKILEVEVLGQLDYYEQHGDFPEDQYSFALTKLG